MTVQELLEAVRDGNVTVEEAETLLKKKAMRSWNMQSLIPDGKTAPDLRKWFTAAERQTSIF